MTKIIIDSSGELTDEMKSCTDIIIESAPLTLEVDGKVYVDDSNLDINNYVDAMEGSKQAVKTAAVSPEQFLEGYKADCDQVFVVTLSSKLSATYSNAMLAKQMYLEEFGEKAIHVFDSFSASVSETVSALKIMELVRNGLSHSEIIEKASEFIKKNRTFFILDRFDNLVKSGRMSPLIAKTASVLSIKLVCTAKEGEIALHEKARGYKNALKKMIDTIVDEKIDFKNSVLAISHCRALEKATELRDELLKKTKFKDIVIVEMRGLSSTYAAAGSIIVSY
ncbi:MAG: DegV family protein [Defluviitaleaceae bacterium]|nr:DegV family protein [Defluviitaleaceae bacterium]